MKVKQTDNKIEKKILLGMIISDRFLRDVQAIYDPALIQIPYVKIVANWCVKYYKKYEKAPREHIQDMYDRQIKGKRIDDTTAELIGKFLGKLSSEYERGDKLNADYLLDQAEDRFNTQKMLNDSEDVKILIEQGDILEAKKVYSESKLIERTSGNETNPNTDKDSVIKAFEESEKPLFTFPGAYGKLINPHLVRDGFIGIMGREKIGKTYQLQEFAHRALRARCNVAFFAVGDMSKNQMILRNASRLCGKHWLKEYCGEITTPVLDCVKNQNNTCTMDNRCCNFGLFERDEKFKVLNVIDKFKKGQFPKNYNPCTFCVKNRPYNFSGSVSYETVNVGKEPLDWREAYKKGLTFSNNLKGKRYLLSVHPSRSINVKGICSILDIWENTKNFIPDVVIIDYADILAPEDSRRDFRQQEFDRWTAMRALSQDRHCLAVSATQADAASYTARTLSMKNFSEDKRKFGQVTGMLGLNQTEEEKLAHLLRVNWVVLRSGEFNIGHTITVLQCLSRGNPLIASF